MGEGEDEWGSLEKKLIKPMYWPLPPSVNVCFLPCFKEERGELLPGDLESPLSS